MKAKKAGYKLNTRTGDFIIENYNFSKPFANFFPGIAGPYGIPIWVFYVNRGQAIASFGTKDKDQAILEFLPANKAWQLTPLQGFRTFLKISTAKDFIYYEPFANGAANSKFNITNRMLISSSDLSIEEENRTLGLSIKAEFFTIPNDNYGGLARILTIRNTSRTAKKIQLLDGLPQIICFGMNNWFMKKMSRTIEAWMNVKNLENNAPFYKLAVEPSDTPEVIHITEGNFYLAFHYDKQKGRVIKPIVDPQTIFGSSTDFIAPSEFIDTKNFRYPKEQLSVSKTPGGFLFAETQLGQSCEKSYYSVCGYMHSCQTLNSSIPRIITPGYLNEKKIENRNLIESLQKDIRTVSSSREFDLYAAQTYLDNILRGGYPLSFKSKTDTTIFYVYSRKHGDLERDYNKFLIQPTYFSQGNGNYRDVNQNRRNDTWFNPDIKDENLITFFNLSQSDGFNPLVVKGATFSLREINEAKNILSKIIDDKSGREKLLTFLNTPFTPGEIILFTEKNNIKLNVSADEFLNLLLSCCHKNQEADHGEGFWTDHWTYNLDLLENYLKIYPENLEEILFKKRAFTFYDNTETVKPREGKYVLYNGQIKQLHAVCVDTAKKEIIHNRTKLPHISRTQYGKADIYRTTLVNKILCLIVNKMASLDPFGIGIEMESDKPNWYDALNGLPALLGSSLCETLELKRLIIFLKDSLVSSNNGKIPVTEEIYSFLANLDKFTRGYFENNHADKDYYYWNQTHLLKEEYRFKTKFGFSGNELDINKQELTGILEHLLKKLDTGIEKAFDKQKNIYYTYFINEVSEHRIDENQRIQALKFRQKKLPFFLESQVHALKICKDANKARSLYKGVKQSSLYDKKLLMYKVCASLKEMPEEIGRCRVFTPGWLENESIWLHMEYKYLLEILRSGLYEEFYDEFKKLLIPFQKAQEYGRSILENSSFIVSSAFPDKKLHGNGFVARLSGSTAEFIQIWLIMNIGTTPFFLNNKKELNLCFKPVLAGWLFDKQNNYSFNFLKEINVTYHNPQRKNTFGTNAAKVEKISFNDKNNAPVQLSSEIIPCSYAEQIRAREITKIDILLK